MVDDYPSEPAPSSDKPTKVYKGVISGRIEKWRDNKKAKELEKGATQEEIEQLKLNLQRARLQNEIEQNKAAMKKNKKGGFAILRDILGSQNKNLESNGPREPRHRSKTPRPVKQKDLDYHDVIGRNDKDYDSLW